MLTDLEHIASPNHYNSHGTMSIQRKRIDALGRRRAIGKQKENRNERLNPAEKTGKLFRIIAPTPRKRRSLYPSSTETKAPSRRKQPENLRKAMDRWKKNMERVCKVCALGILAKAKRTDPISIDRHRLDHQRVCRRPRCPVTCTGRRPVSYTHLTLPTKA